MQQDTCNCRQLECVGGGGQHFLFVVVGCGSSFLNRGRSGVTGICKGVPIVLWARSKLKTRICF